ncbi:MAG: hypothetical protein B6D37_06445 [Sphingobacteriales bacterium UTBCD1]|jgi:hypothetical protein|nr:MAG: hypothetical protein B6D37_06445 [Sphingobacteriales bacterium UTBCD1]
MKQIYPFTIFILVLFANCSPSEKIIRFPKLPDEVFVNNNLKEFFKSNKSPNIVLRVPNNNDKATSNTSISADNNILYNAIEKELLKEGFSVRDRGLFNELLSKSQTSDYSNIKELTNTDIILEVVNINPAVVYTTNKVTVISKKKTTEQIGNLNYKKYGASVEFRVIMVRNNEIAGTYKYNYQPCPDGCEVGTFKFTGKRGLKNIELKETVAINTMEKFITFSTQDLIKSIRE